MLSLVRLSNPLWRSFFSVQSIRLFSSNDNLGKLVRDKIPSIIEKSGKGCQVALCKGEAYRKALQKKLYEEVNELNEADTDDHWLEELADVQEVVLSLLKAKNYRPEDLEEKRALKHEERGGFDQGIILIRTFEK